ncbi:MAG: glycosyltransferase family 4 protein [Armatimonadota bacterium]|nr:glycosyltransferase family 4 protein [Armatimonadota bacterium]MDR7438948.1 glycosyltransferase family 4 protein [Armatimonadota bacterium]MDR7562846.1 glycosyltransferase family 4 protein [Armatimonadota bacterium]MDR7567883.1 glycosyltransferase family 4 protein [Armatimonadota bacterium]MDR7601359.1 glycosyltransferase family 4 protein [Armatimonadota bacterium]
MRICLLCQEYPSEVRSGGIGTYTHTLARSLARAGCRVHVVARAACEPSTREEEGVVVHRIAPAPDLLQKVARPLTGHQSFLDAYAYSRAAAAKVREILRREGLEVVQSPEHGAEGLVLFRNGEDLPHVVRLHTPLALVNEAAGKKLSPGGWIVHWMERAAARRATLNTCASRALARQVAARFGIPPRRIRVVPNAIDHEMFSPAPAPASEEPTVLYVGKLAPLKGALVLAEAIPHVLRRVPEARFVCVGSDHTTPGAGSTLERMMATLRESGAEGRIHFLQSVPRPELVSLYRQARVVVLPTFWDNFPNTLLEAMACGIPVVASAVGGVVEMVTHEREGMLVPPGNPERLAEAISRLLLDPDRRREMGRMGREKVLREYTPHRAAQRTLEVYGEAIRRHRERHRRTA